MTPMTNLAPVFQASAMMDSEITGLIATLANRSRANLPDAVSRRTRRHNRRRRG